MGYGLGAYEFSDFGDELILDEYFGEAGQACDFAFPLIELSTIEELYAEFQGLFGLEHFSLNFVVWWPDQWYHEFDQLDFKMVGEEDFLESVGDEDHIVYGQIGMFLFLESMNLLSIVPEVIVQQADHEGHQLLIARVVLRLVQHRLDVLFGGQQLGERAQFAE